MGARRAVSGTARGFAAPDDDCKQEEVLTVFPPQSPVVLGKRQMKTLRHPPSKELWKFCMDRLRELRGPDTRERDLANMLGFEHSRAVRWKEGQMYVDRAEYLVRLADALDVEPMLLVAMASGTLTVEQAHRQIAGVG